MVVVEEHHERLLVADEERRRAVAQALGRLGQVEADAPDLGESSGGGGVVVHGAQCRAPRNPDFCDRLLRESRLPFALVEITAPSAYDPGGAVRLDPRPFRGWRDGIVAAVFVAVDRRLRDRGRDLGPRRGRARHGVLVDGVPRVDRGVPQHLGGRPRRARVAPLGHVAHAARRPRHGRRHRPRRAGHRPVDQRPGCTGSSSRSTTGAAARAPSTASASSSPTPSAAAPHVDDAVWHALARP